MKLTLIIPIYISNELHLDFTRQTLASIKTKHDYEVIVVNNFCDPKFTPHLRRLATRDSRLVNNPKGNILAAAWNLGINSAFDQVAKPETRVADYCLILNNDIIFHPQCIDNLVIFAQDHPDFLLWSASQWSNLKTLNQAVLTKSWSPHPHFSCFMLSNKTFKTVGTFDEKFNFGYFEDNDYHTRILIKGGVAAATDSAKFYHYGSRTTAVDDDLAVEAKYHYQLNRKYFQKKWGLDIHGQAFDPPESILNKIKRGYPH